MLEEVSMIRVQRSGRGGLIALLSATASVAALAAPGLVQAAETASGTSVDEVVVTASKQPETVKNTPTALSVLGADTLNKLGISQFSDYMTYVPGMSFNDVGAPGHGTVILRGLNTGWEQTSATVGFYVDESPFAPNSPSAIGALVNPDPDLADVERVEVLKGPQSTLYGARSLGGVIRVVSLKPDLETFSGSIRISGSEVEGGGGGYGLRGSVNIPLVEDKVAIRLSAYRRGDPGWSDNVRTGDEDVNSDRATGAKFALLMKPTEKLSITLNGLIQDLDINGVSQTDLDPDTLKPISGYDKYSAAFNPHLSAKMSLLNLTADYQAGPGTLTSATSYTRYRNSDLYDYTGPYGILLPAFGLNATDYAMLGVLNPGMDKFTQEVRYSSDRIGRLQFLAGLFYTREAVQYNVNLAVASVPSGQILPPPFNDIVTANTAANYEEYAGFGDVTFFITDDLDVMGGIRLGHNNQHSLAVGTGLLTGPSNEPSQSSENNTDYLATIRWRPTPYISTYLRAASGYRPGGPQFSPVPGANASFRSDKVWNYEAGIKGSTPDHLLTFDLAAYHIDWTDIQLNQLVGGLTVTGNGGDAKVDGVEANLTLTPVAGLVFGANGAYTDARMSKLDPTSTVGAAIGDALPFTPKWAGALTADYSFPITPDMNGGVGASLRYQGDRHSGFPGDVINTDRIMPAYTAVDLRASIDWYKSSLIFRVTNVGNEHGLTGFSLNRIAPIPQPALGTYAAPRTFSLSFETRF